MKRAKLIVTAFAVLAVVGSALAFTGTHFLQGQVYCHTNGTTCTTKIDFKVDAAGSVIAPCGVDANSNPLPVYQQLTTTCPQVAGPFSATPF